jgi:hypothetical protein
MYLPVLVLLIYHQHHEDGDGRSVSENSEKLHTLARLYPREYFVEKSRISKKKVWGKE